MLKFTINPVSSVGPERRGTLVTKHGTIQTPAFMPVGSLGVVKGLDSHELQQLGYGLILHNAYHLFLRPGHQVVAQMGGLHKFTSWPGAILTDSGGFQVYSLAKFCKVTDDGVTFQSHIDGSSHHITPEGATHIQEALGADIIMAFDECVPLPSPQKRVEEALRRTHQWARRCQSARQNQRSSMFGIVQGGFDPILRVQAARELRSIDFEGFAVGGLSVGEEKSAMYAMLDVTVPELPVDRPRYLMGVGMPEDLVEGVARGIDLFDCVVPTRHGRTGWLFTSFGRVLIKQAQYATDDQPIDPTCSCSVCRQYSRAFLHHLYKTKEMLGVRLNTLHNLHYFADLMTKIRNAITQGSFRQFRDEFFRQRLAIEAGGEDSVPAGDLDDSHMRYS